MNVNERDHKRERWVFKQVMEKIPSFQFYKFYQKANKTALYDVIGNNKEGNKTHCVDIKVREDDIREYETDIVSKDKIDHLKTCKCLHYLCIYYIQNNTIIVYNLDSVPKEEKDIRIYHKREKREIDTTIYKMKKIHALTKFVPKIPLDI